MVGRSGDRKPVGGEIFRTCPDRPWGPPSLLYNGTGSFPGVKSGRGVTLTPQSLLVPWSWKSRAIPLFPYRPYGLYRASVPVHFTFTLPLHVSNITCSSSGRLLVLAVFTSMFFIYLWKQSSRWKTHHKKPHVRIVFLMMNTWCSKQEEGMKSWIKRLM